MQGKPLPDYILAEGPEGLTKALTQLLDQSGKDASFAADPHYVLYQLGNQKSLIKIDMSEKPFYFWYYDLLGRPATNGVKDTIARFMKEKFGGKEGSNKGETINDQK